MSQRQKKFVDENRARRQRDSWTDARLKSMQRAARVFEHPERVKYCDNGNLVDANKHVNLVCVIATSIQKAASEFRFSMSPDEFLGPFAAAGPRVRPSDTHVDGVWQRGRRLLYLMYRPMAHVAGLPCPRDQATTPKLKFAFLTEEVRNWLRHYHGLLIMYGEIGLLVERAFTWRDEHSPTYTWSNTIRDLDVPLDKVPLPEGTEPHEFQQYWLALLERRLAIYEKEQPGVFDDVLDAFEIAEDEFKTHTLTTNISRPVWPVHARLQFDFNVHHEPRPLDIARYVKKSLDAHIEERAILFKLLTMPYSIVFTSSRRDETDENRARKLLRDAYNNHVHGIIGPKTVIYTMYMSLASTQQVADGLGVHNGNCLWLQGPCPRVLWYKTVGQIRAQHQARVRLNGAR